MNRDGGWEKSADAWMESQGELGDMSRREILDPALEPILLEVAGRSVLDVGCGEGRYCRKLAALGALVTGIDPVSKMIDRARNRDPVSRYDVGRAEKMPYPDSTFDLVLSYLSLIDIEDDLAAMSEMNRVLKPGGELVIVTLSNLASTSSNWITNADGTKLYRTVDRYMECFELKLAWKGINIVNWHRPLSRILGALLGHGLRLTRFIEPLPAEGSPWYEDEYRVPTFQIMTFRKPNAQ